MRYIRYLNEAFIEFPDHNSFLVIEKLLDYLHLKAKKSFLVQGDDPMKCMGGVLDFNRGGFT